MAIIKVLGLDPSLRNWGISAGTYCTETNIVTIKTLEVVCADLPTGKQVRQNSLDLETAYQVFAAVQKYLGAQAIFVEVPHGSQSARSMASYGVCVGVLGSIRAAGTPFFEVTASEVKRASCGIKTATKEQMIDWAVKAHPEAPWPTQKVKGEVSIIKGKAEHMADATAAIYAGVSSNQFKQFAAFKL